MRLRRAKTTEVLYYGLCNFHGKTRTAEQTNINNLLRNSLNSVLQTWLQKCTSQKKQNDNFCVVAMATLLAPVSFCETPNMSLAQKTEGHHIVFTLSIRLLGVDDPCLRLICKF